MYLHHYHIYNFITLFPSFEWSTFLALFFNLPAFYCDLIEFILLYYLCLIFVCFPFVVINKLLSKNRNETQYFKESIAAVVVAVLTAVTSV